MELKTKEVLPDQIFPIFKNMETEQVKWNKHCKSCYVYDRDLDILVTQVNPPFPLSPRIVFNYRFLWEFPER